MTDHTIGILALWIGGVSLVVMLVTLGVAAWTLVATRRGVVHAETAARAAQASLDDLQKKAEAATLTSIEEGILRTMLDTPGESFGGFKNHFPGGFDLVLFSSGDHPFLKVSPSVLIRLEDLGHIAESGPRTWNAAPNLLFFGTNFKLTPQGRALAAGIQGAAKDMALSPLAVSREQAMAP